MSAMLTQALQLASANAANAHIAAATTSSSTSPTPGGEPSAASANASTPVDMEVDSGVRNKRAEGYIPQLPQLNYASMTSRHAEIRVWTAYRDELTSWLCLLDDRYATELQEAISSNVEVLQVKLEAGKAARSTKLLFLLRQSMSKFQRGQDLVHLIEVKQMGASAGYELWRSLNNELSVRSRVEGQALREQALGLVPPKHLKRPLDVARWYTTELLKFEAQVKHRFPELLIGEQEGVLCLMKHLDSETKRYLLLHHSTKSMGELMTGLQFYDEQLRVMDFQREGASGYANAFKGGKGGKGDRDKSNKGSKGNKGNKGEKGEKGQKGGKAKGKDRKGDQGGKGDRARSKSREAKKTDVCRNCGKTGHWARDCWAPSKDKAAAATSHRNSRAQRRERRYHIPTPFRFLNLHVRTNFVVRPFIKLTSSFGVAALKTDFLISRATSTLSAKSSSSAKMALSSSGSLPLSGNQSRSSSSLSFALTTLISFTLTTLILASTAFGNAIDIHWHNIAGIMKAFLAFLQPIAAGNTGLPLCLSTIPPEHQLTQVTVGAVVRDDRVGWRSWPVKQQLRRVANLLFSGSPPLSSCAYSSKAASRRRSC